MGLNKLVNLGLAGVIAAGSVISVGNALNVYSTKLQYEGIENQYKLQDGHELAITKDMYREKQNMYATNIVVFGSLAMVSGMALYTRRRKD